MTIMHYQVALAVSVFLTCGAGLEYMNASSDAKKAKAQLAELQAPVRPGPAAVPEPVKAKPARDLEKDLRESRLYAEGLANRVKQLEAQNEELKKQVALLQQSVAKMAAQPAPAPLGTVASTASVAPPPPPPPPQNTGVPAGSWGAAENSEMNELVAAVKLSPEQTEATRKIIMDSQQEFQDKLLEAQRTGERDIHVIEQIGNEVSKRAQDRIRQILFPEQQEPFNTYMRGKEQAR